jgi:indolepyruvate ferredoxin oxidoreductase beta subunit
MSGPVTNVVFAGIGGQGVLRASDILASAAFSAGQDVKKAEIHGMSQRGGSVTSDVRFGTGVLSPMVPHGSADYLVVLSADQVDANRPALAAGGVLISAEQIDEDTLPHKRSLNVALLGMLSTHLEFPEEAWMTAIAEHLPAKVHEVNREAFQLGRRLGEAG